MKPGVGEPSVEVYVEEIVLHGFPAVDGRRVGEAFLAELERLLAGGAMLDGDAESVDAGSSALAEPASPEAIGALAARGVYGGMAK
ncbi:MAG TPA: hypothetical protein VGM37_17600 [Armatimonadota bacterium]|jgi:hypothetical protein